MSAAMLLDALSPKFAEAQQVKKDDARLETSSVEFPSPQGSGTARGYLVRPANSAGKKLPAILVVHENRGLNPHIEDIARRIALDGYMAFAPDALFSMISPCSVIPDERTMLMPRSAKLRSVPPSTRNLPVASSSEMPCGTLATDASAETSRK